MAAGGAAGVAPSPVSFYQRGNFFFFLLVNRVDLLSYKDMSNAGYVGDMMDSKRWGQTTSASIVIINSAGAIKKLRPDTESS